MDIFKTDNIDVVILCGGLGTRLQPVINDRPKPMAEIDDRPFLDLLINYVAGYGFKRFILCVGFMKDVIKNYYGKGTGFTEIVFSEEQSPLGTAGALKNSEDKIKSEIFLVLNGDSVCFLDLHDFLQFHLSREALLTLALSEIKSKVDYGQVVLDDSGLVISFKEKEAGKSNLVNAGVYLFSKSLLSYIPANKNCSLEYDIFPDMVEKNFFGYVTDKKFTDIGTPERYNNALKILNKSS